MPNPAVGPGSRSRTAGPDQAGRPGVWLGAVLTLAVALASVSCGGSPTTPTPPTPPVTPAPTLTGVTPTTGSTNGGTAITLTGTNFGAGATVTIGGAAATSVSVDSTTSIRAVTPARAAGAADIVVSVGTQSATLPGAFTFVAPPQNAPPTIAAITVQGTRPNQPPNFADLNEEVVVTATVTDPETPVGQLTFEWSATVGTFTGTGPVVRWRAPSQGATPLTVTLTLTVTETWAGAAGMAVAPATQTVTGTASVDLHDSTKEIADLTYDFLLNFSKQTPPPEYVVRNFYSGCAGAESELADVRKNQRHYRITNWKLAEHFPVKVEFGGRCDYRNRDGDGCAFVPVEWTSTCIETFEECTAGQTRTDIGTDQTTMVFREKRWWLCDSDWDPISTTPAGLPAFIR